MRWTRSGCARIRGSSRSTSTSKPASTIHSKQYADENQWLSSALCFPRYREYSSMRDCAFERGVNLRFQTFPEQKRFHIHDQKLLMLRIDRAQTVMVDQLVLGHHPGLPATLANLFVDLFAQRVAERRFFQCGDFLLAARAFDDFGHFFLLRFQSEMTASLSGRHYSIATAGISAERGAMGDVTKHRPIVSITFTGSLLGFHQKLI